MKTRSIIDQQHGWPSGLSSGFSINHDSGQTFADSITYCLMLVSFQVIAPDGVPVVLATTTAWELAHEGGG
ncbi:hypothetical protein Y032_0055g2626 [Ancylostoma ceylanicum]|uniref:Uncharacterized protein n=1 Tax=Ancylostoma ceylanicum TaxID=53326 RepID=A0A016U7M5_9BILA|nr:hypothetical protein Y032_0055g2626 [Ancylostoma ceylanicum]